MTEKRDLQEWLFNLPEWPRARLAQLPTPIHPLKNFTRYFSDLELWIKRDDLTGLAGGGNKTRKLDFLVGDAIRSGADTLVTVGAIQSNHTRQTASAAAKCGLHCALLHCSWTKDAGPGYRQVGNILLSSILGADLYLDEQKRPIEDQGPLDEFIQYLKTQGRAPYLIPGGASEHRLGSLGYIACAAEIVEQSRKLGVHFDYLVHCTGSSGTQSGLVAGFSALGEKTRVIGIPDDEETEIKKKRVHLLANNALAELGLPTRVRPDDIEITAADKSPYGIAEEQTFEAIRLFARSEGLLADPVYEGKAIRGLLELAKQGRFEKNCRILLMHLGGTPAVHAYASQFEPVHFLPFP
jgi:1-aminocyclopropane-1-carboxylate deaminase